MKLELWVLKADARFLLSPPRLMTTILDALWTLSSLWELKEFYPLIEIGVGVSLNLMGGSFSKTTSSPPAINRVGGGASSSYPGE